MPCLRLPSHLHRSPYGVYHFRLVLLAAFAVAAGTREIWRSLRTRDPVRATLLAYSLNIRFKLLLMAKAKPTVQDLLKLTQDEFQQLTIKGLQVGEFQADSVHLGNPTPETCKRDQEALHSLLNAFASVPPIPLSAEEIAAAEAEAEAAAGRRLREGARTKPLDECVPLYLSSKGGLAPSPRVNCRSAVRRLLASNGSGRPANKPGYRSPMVGRNTTKASRRSSLPADRRRSCPRLAMISVTDSESGRS